MDWIRIQETRGDDVGGSTKGLAGRRMGGGGGGGEGGGGGGVETGAVGEGTLSMKNRVLQRSQKRFIEWRTSVAFNLKTTSIPPFLSSDRSCLQSILPSSVCQRACLSVCLPLPLWASLRIFECPLLSPPPLPLPHPSESLSLWLCLRVHACASLSLSLSLSLSQT